MAERPNYAPEIKRALCDVRRLCDALGLTARDRKFMKQAGGLIVLCPEHTEDTPSCSVQLRHGVILWNCHGCSAGGDAIALVAAARGMSLRGAGFREVLIESARIAGLWAVVHALESSDDRTAIASPPLAKAAPAREEASEPPRVYPEDAGAFWDCLGGFATEELVSSYLRSRAIDPELVEAKDLARVIPDHGALPPWARYRGQSWRETGHMIIVPMFDASGAIRSVRAWRCTDGDSPKRLPPGGHKASELVMADQWALAWLRGQRQPERVVIAEGEPDFMTWAVRLNDPATATIGIISGSWHAALANRFPIGCRVDVRVDHDEAGERYFREIESGLRRRCFVFRSQEAA